MIQWIKKSIQNNSWEKDMIDMIWINDLILSRILVRHFSPCEPYLVVMLTKAVHRILMSDFVESQCWPLLVNKVITMTLCMAGWRHDIGSGSGCQIVVVPGAFGWYWVLRLVVGSEGDVRFYDWVNLKSIYDEFIWRINNIYNLKINLCLLKKNLTF